MQDVTRYGTAARAARLGRSDLAGKTGTTNEFVDAWFAGYQPALVAISWVGFDQPRRSARTRRAAWSRCRSGLATWSACCPTTPRWRAPCRRAWCRADHGALRRAEDDSEFFYREAVPPPDVLTPPPPPPAPTPLPEQSNPRPSSRESSSDKRSEELAAPRIAPCGAVPAEVKAAERAATQISRAAPCRLTIIFPPSSNSISRTPPSLRSKSSLGPRAHARAAPALGSHFESRVVHALTCGFYALARSSPPARWLPAAVRRAAFPAREPAAGVKPPKPKPYEPVPYPPERTEEEKK